jgi:hypothetical protein
MFFHPNGAIDIHVQDAIVSTSDNKYDCILRRRNFSYADTLYAIAFEFLHL